jgi:hypothetical protein
MNPDLKKKLDEYIQILRERNRLIEESRKVADELAPLVAPFRVGDVIQNRGYGHWGKMGRVTSISVDDQARLFVRVRILRKDGSEGNRWDGFKISIREDGTIPTYEEEFPPRKDIKITEDML